MKAKKIVCFGGGNAVPRVVLEPLKQYPLEITAVTSMTDDGGSTGQLRRDFGVLPPGDIRRHILALSDAPEWKKRLWSFRFGSEEFEGGHRGHNFGNIFLAGLEKSMKNYDEALQKCCRFMEVSKKHRALPATLTKTTLCAKLADGTTIEGESEIDVPKRHDAKTPIAKIFLRPNAKANKVVIAAIENADALVFGPGDLYSSTLACFLPVGIKTAIGKSKAKKILIVNILNKHGETDGFSVVDFARAVERYIGTGLDAVLYNNHAIDKEVFARTKREDRSVLREPEFDGTLEREKFIGGNLVKRGAAAHDPKKTGEMVWKLLNK